MSSIKTTQIDGDVSVGRNVAAGGNARVQGNMRVGHNLKVEGWLDAANIRGANKGLFLTKPALEATYPHPHEGWFACVGTSSPYTAYVGSEGVWVQTEGTVELSVDLGAFADEVEQLGDDLDEVRSAVSDNSDDIAANTQQISTLGSTLASVATTASNANTLSLANAATIAEHTTTLAEHSTAIGSASSSIVALQGSVGDNTTAITGLQGRMTAAESDTALVRTGYRIAGFIGPNNSYLAKAVEHTCYICMNPGSQSWWDNTAGHCYLPPSDYAPSGDTAPELQSLEDWTYVDLSSQDYAGFAVLFGYKSGTWIAHRLPYALKATTDGIITRVTDLEGNSGGKNIYNVTKENNGATYASLSSAVAAVPSRFRALGECVTYLDQNTGWVSKQFTGTSLSDWTDASKWDDFGGGGTIKNISYNGVVLQPTSDGTVNIEATEVTVDSTLSMSSSNPVENRAISAKLAELEAGTVASMDVETGTDSVTLNLYNSSDTENPIASVEIPAIGGGGGESSATKIVLTTSVDNAVVVSGGSSRLTYSYDHVNVSDNTSTGMHADITLRVKRGGVTVYEAVRNNVSPGSGDLDLTAYLQNGTTDVYVIAEVDTGETIQRKQSYKSVTMHTLNLECPYDIANSVADGGVTGNVVIPFAVTGSSQSTVFLYVDGDDEPLTSMPVLRTDRVTGSFAVDTTSWSNGRHVVQMVARMTVSGIPMTSHSFFIDIYKGSASSPVIAVKAEDSTGTIQEGAVQNLHPEVHGEQYESLSFKWAVYDPNNTTASVRIRENASEVQVVAASRIAQTFEKRYSVSGTVYMSLVCSPTLYTMSLILGASSIGLNERVADLLAKLSAAGRNNNEANPAQWTYEGVTTTFSGVDWKSDASGWKNNTLTLTNGASCTIGCYPFDDRQETVAEGSHIAQVGRTVEFDILVDNIGGRDDYVASCVTFEGQAQNPRGFYVTADTIYMLTGRMKEVVSDDDTTSLQPVGLKRQYASKTWQKVALVLHPSASPLMELYVNGVRCAADVYSPGDDQFNQSAPVGITFSSTGADVSIRNVRVYKAALSDDEIITDYILDQQQSADMLSKNADNDIMAEVDTNVVDVSVSKLTEKGKAVMVIATDGGLDAVNAVNDKNTNFKADVQAWLPDGRNVRMNNVIVRIQGTSSTKYPSKNYRIYTKKVVSGMNDGVNAPQMYINDVNQGPSPKISLRPGQPKVSVLCPKADYSDSSMAQNTGGARLWNNLMLSLESSATGNVCHTMTPPQRFYLDTCGFSISDIPIRQSIDGYPVDVFSATSLDDTSTYRYYGQYNLNHDKSDWADIIGMSNISYTPDGGSAQTFTPSCPIALEFLNNSKDGCLFRGISSFSQSNFAEALEFNYPKDTVWSGAGQGETNASQTQQTKINRLWSWIYAKVSGCASSHQDKNYSTYSFTTSEVMTYFQSASFKSEVSSYINVDSMLAWYVFTDLFMNVDQRAKNMILCTWDGDHWYFIYYDGDTQMGDRNDSYLAYDYRATRDTKDGDVKYVFEGHDSWLWNLVLANFQDELKAMAQKIINALPLARAKAEFDSQTLNWCERAYNKSGYMKYIRPAIDGVIVNGNLTYYNYIYALKGDKKSFRDWFLDNRYAMLEANYGTTQAANDNIQMYVEKSPGNAYLKFTPADDWSFRIRSANYTYMPTEMVSKDVEKSYNFSGESTKNDPVFIDGASRIKAIDFSQAWHVFVGTINFNLCVSLESIDLHKGTNDTSSASWNMQLDQCRQLKTVYLNGNTNAGTGSDNSHRLDFSNQMRLEHLDARDTAVESVTFARGGSISTAKLGGSIKRLRLIDLPYLSLSTDNGVTGLSLQNWASVTHLEYRNCPNIDWKAVVALCPNLQYIRIEGIDVYDDGSIFSTYGVSHYKRITANGTEDSSHGGLCGTVHLTSYDENISSTQASYPDLTVVQSQYTEVEFDDTEDDPWNMTNKDNGTSGSSYVSSGHINAVLKGMKMVQGQVTNGVFNGRVVADHQTNWGTRSSDIDWTDAAGVGDDSFLYLPKFWMKGVNDHVNNKKYTFISSSATEPLSTSTIVRRSTLQSLGAYRTGRALSYADCVVGGSAAFIDASGYNVYMFNVEGMKQVRWPGVNNGSFCCVFLNSSNVIVSKFQYASSAADCDFDEMQYLFITVPATATSFMFTSPQAYPEQEVIAVDSDKVEAIEPDWVEEGNLLFAKYWTYYDITTRARSIPSSNNNGNSTDLSSHLAAITSRGYQLLSYDTYRVVVNLLMLATGTRNSQQNGVRILENTVTSGILVDGVFGIAKLISNQSNPYLCFDKICSSFESYASFLASGRSTSVGTPTGYLSIPEGTSERRVIRTKNYSSHSTHSGFDQSRIIRLRHGRYCDIIPSIVHNGSNANQDSTYYCDGVGNPYNNGPVGMLLVNNTMGGVFSLCVGRPVTESGYVRMEYRGAINLTV